MANKPAPKKALTKKKQAKKVAAKKKVAPSKTPKNVVTVDGRDRRPWALASRERLLEAATEEIAAVGFERARLAEIASRADMTPGSVYTWFANKEELFRAAPKKAPTKKKQATKVAAKKKVAPSKTPRSEERREGKECRSRWSPYH